MFIYIFLLNLIYVISVPFILLKFNGREKKERIGKITIDFDSVIWVHAASVGEVNAIKPLLTKLLTLYPNRNFIISTMTRTGQKEAQKISPKLVTIFLPIDFPIPMWRAFRKLKPEMIILVETELWPNMLFQAKNRNIPVCIVNGRISDKSFKTYKKMNFFWKSLFKAIKLVNAQSQEDKEKFEVLGFNNVVNTNNLKFCVDYPLHNKENLKKKLGFNDEDFIIVWGSSRPGEEKLLEKIYPQIQEKIPNLKLVVAPRHLSRIVEVKEIFKQHSPSFYSSIEESKITLIDEMGILILYYCIADISIVGGSFYDFGGHNPLEPAFYGSPTIIGKYNSSCRDSVVKLLTNNAIIVSDRKQIAKDILDLFLNPKKAEEIGEKAKETVENNSNSLGKNIAILKDYITE